MSKPFSNLNQELFAPIFGRICGPCNFFYQEVLINQINVNYNLEEKKIMKQLDIDMSPPTSAIHIIGVTGK